MAFGRNKAAETAKEISNKLDILTVSLDDKSTSSIFKKLLRPLTEIKTKTVSIDGKTKQIQTKVTTIANNTAAMLNIQRAIYNTIKAMAKHNGVELSKINNQQAEAGKLLKKNNHIALKSQKLTLPKDTIKTLSVTQEKSMSKALKNSQKEAAKDEKSKNFQQSLITKKNEKKLTKSKDKSDKSGSKLAFNLGALAKGIAKFLKALLNPMALIMAFISKFLPYILIFGAMLYGAWCALGEELQNTIKEKVEWFMTSVLPYAIGAFLLWKVKGIIFHGIIKALNFAFHTLRMIFLKQEHTKAMAQLDKEMVFTTIEHGQRQAATFKDVLLRIVEFVLKQAAAIMDMILRGIEFALKIAAIAIAVVLVGLAIGILILALAKIFIYIANLVLDLIAKAFEILMPIAEYMLDCLLKIGIGLFEGVALVISTFFIMLIAVLAVSGFIGGMFGGKDKDTNKVETTNGVTESIFTEQLSRIIEPLNILTKQMTALIAIQTASLAMNPISMISSGIFGIISYTINHIKNNAVANDSTQNNINSSNASINNNNNDLLQETNRLLKIINENVYTIANNQVSMHAGNGVKSPTR